MLNGQSENSMLEKPLVQNPLRDRWRACLTRSPPMITIEYHRCDGHLFHRYFQILLKSQDI